MIDLFIAESAGVEMHRLEEAIFIAGVGLKGDRYAAGKGHYSHLPHPDRQVTLIELEAVDAVATAIGEPVAPIEFRRNVITQGVRINELVDQYFRVGETLLYKRTTERSMPVPRCTAQGG